jgi:hypothetical protein
MNSITFAQLVQDRLSGGRPQSGSEVLDALRSIVEQKPEEFAQQGPPIELSPAEVEALRLLLDRSRRFLGTVETVDAGIAERRDQLERDCGCWSKLLLERVDGQAHKEKA